MSDSRLPQRDDGRGTAETGELPFLATPVSADVPHLERACELLWQAGHPRIADALEKEVLALSEKASRLGRILYPGPDFAESRATEREDTGAHEGSD